MQYTQRSLVSEDNCPMNPYIMVGTHSSWGVYSQQVAVDYPKPRIL